MILRLQRKSICSEVRGDYVLQSCAKAARAHQYDFVGEIRPESKGLACDTVSLWRCYD
jgi:hypothetical protein